MSLNSHFTGCFNAQIFVHRRQLASEEYNELSKKDSNAFLETKENSVVLHGALTEKKSSPDITGVCR